ncbi:glycosyltransferase [Chloroflexota bacterium]
MTTTKVLPDGTVYSRRKNFQPFSAHPLEAYSSIVGEKKIERLLDVSPSFKNLKLLELNSTAQGGGVAEMLYSSVPFLNMLGIDVEWKIINGHASYFECTKTLHNLLQGMKGTFTSEMKDIYRNQIGECVTNNIIDYAPNVVNVNDPQPMLLCRFLKKKGDSWLWRCHIDIEPAIKSKNGLLSLINDWIADYDAAIFSASRYVFPGWPVPKFVIPPFIDPLSEKNRELSKKEIDKVLHKYAIDPKIPIIAQIGRFDPWKGIDRTIETFRQVRKAQKCQLIIAGGSAYDDPESERILNNILQDTKDDEAINVLNLSLSNRLENHREVNALQRAASVIMQPSTREGFGLVVTEALWKSKPVIAGRVGGMAFQIQNGKTGYFYQNSKATAEKIIFLLNNPIFADSMGRKAKRYVQDHFLIIDRMIDYLMTIGITMEASNNQKKRSESITSFYPW